MGFYENRHKTMKFDGVGCNEIEHLSNKCKYLDGTKTAFHAFVLLHV